MNTALLLRRAMMGASGNEGTIKYGYLYNWYVTQGTGNASIIPSAMESLGWVVPTYNNGAAFISYLMSHPELFPFLNFKNSGLRHYTGSQFSSGTLYFWESTKTTDSNRGDVFFNSQPNNYVNFTNGGWLQFTYGNPIRLVRPATPQDPPNDGDYCLPYIGNDGTSYLTVRIGNQVWMAENLAETKYRGGTDITNVTDNTAWAALTSGARCSYNNDEANVFMTPKIDTITTSTSIKYGYLYNWYVTQGTGNASIIPSAMESLGWHVPLIVGDIINTLENVISRAEFGKTKATGTSYWSTPNTGAENKYNMNMLGGGNRTSLGVFTSINTFAGLRTLHPITYPFGWNYMLYNNSMAADVSPFSDGKSGEYLRFVRTATSPEQLLSDGTWCEDYIGNDGRAYKTVKIGTQVWTTENLAETKYRDGSLIPNVTDNTAWSNLATGARCAYGNIEENVFETKTYYNLVQKNIIYGFLYNWYTTQGTGSNSITSSDMWVVPSHLQATTFFNYVNQSSGNKIKEIGDTYWGTNPTNGGTNELNFSARAGGYRYVGGAFGAGRASSSVGSTYFFMWVNTLAAMYIQHENTTSIFGITGENIYTSYKYDGFSLRLVRNATLQEQGYDDGTYCTPYIGNDGQSYKTVKIGTQVWLAENLIETKYRNGLNIVDTVDNTQWAALTQGSYCAYNNVITNSYTIV